MSSGRSSRWAERWHTFVHAPSKAVPHSAAWALLGGLLALTLLSACLYDRAGWERPIAGEATALMQAESLARDFDLRYERRDLDRFAARWGAEPADLELASAGGGRIAYDRPFPHALWLAPFVRLWPRGGFAVAHALLLALAAVAAARLLERRLGALGPFWITLAAFASVTFGYVFLATADLFLLALVVLAFCLLAEESPGRPYRRWALAGLLLAAAAAAEPLLLVLPAAALARAPREAASPARQGLVLGLIVGLVGLAAVDWWSGGGLLWLGAEHFRFTPSTGFPLVDFPAEEWPETLHRLAAMHWDGAPRLSWGLEPRLWLWNGLYLCLGRNIGLLPYFPPLLLLALASGRGRRAGVLWLAALAFLLGLMIFRPFNLAGGEGTIGNRLFLPVYGALWLVVSRRRSWLWGLALALLAAPFLWQLWASPRSAPIAGGDGYRWVAPAAEALLPYETSQRRIPSGEEVRLDALWVRFLNESGWAETRRGRLVVERGGEAEMLIASAERLDVLRLDFGPEAPASLEVGGGKVGERILLPSGGIAFRILPRRARPRHAMWFSPTPHYLYRLSLRWPPGEAARLPFTLVGERVPGS